ncbi:hypothetical protein ACP4OV_022942 [Aristida adscensionis]
MNQFVPNWNSNMAGDAFAPFNGGEDDGLIELLWCNGHVVMQSQAPRKPARPDKTPPAAAAAAVGVQDDEATAAAAAWFQYPVEDPLERDLFSELFGVTPAAAADAGKEGECGGTAVTAPRSRLMPPPPPQATRGKAGVSDGAVEKTDGGEGAGVATEAGGSSMLTIGSSFCGSNHVQAPRAGAGAPPLLRGKAGARDAATVTSSSMRPWSVASEPRTPAAAHRSAAGKRKPRDATDATDAEDAEFESAADVTCEPAPPKPTTAKRRRAAEVHNLSERRRRDRINEKMKALQELIPHCNKTDKASMLDEAIEYLKSLQLQLQMMWMGGGMAAAAAPVMYPAAGAHQYMHRMVAPPARLPFMAPPGMPSHMSVAADAYARCVAVDHLPPPSPMGMSFYQQQNPVAPPPPVVPGPAATAQTPPSDSTLPKRYGNIVASLRSRTGPAD